MSTPNASEKTVTLCVDLDGTPIYSDALYEALLVLVGIDRATRWVYVEVAKNKSATAAKAFLHRLIETAPFKVTKVLTDNGKEFTDRYCATGQRDPTGNHSFDKVCTKHHVEHRLTKPRHPQTNGMVERFNGRISEVVARTHFESAHELKVALLHYVRVYNHSIPQKSIGHISPVQSLKRWKNTHPDLFKKRVYNQTGLDINRSSHGDTEPRRKDRQNRWLLFFRRCWIGARGLSRFVFTGPIRS